MVREGGDRRGGGGLDRTDPLRLPDVNLLKRTGERGCTLLPGEGGCSCLKLAFLFTQNHWSLNSFLKIVLTIDDVQTFIFFLNTALIFTVMIHSCI